MIRGNALVTGASRGIGAATAVRLAELGAGTVVVHHRRSPEAAEHTAQAVRRAGAEAVCVAADLEDADAVEEMFVQIGRDLGSLDFLVASAAASSFKPLLDTHDENIRRTTRITINALLQCVRETTSLAEAGGSVVVVSGIDASEAMVGHGLLGSMKAAAETLTMYLASELGARRFRVNAVRPGLTLTDSSRTYSERVFGDSAEFERLLVSLTPSRRAGIPEDIANVIGFLCSEEGSWINGQVLVADGGLSIVSPTEMIAGGQGGNR